MLRRTPLNATPKHKTGLTPDKLNKIEARKQFRASRANQKKQLLDSKPNEKYEDPKDIAAIQYARANMGEYKLKSASDYIVPETEEISAEKKKQQINLLYEGFNALKEVSIFYSRILIIMFWLFVKKRPL